MEIHKLKEAYKAIKKAQIVDSKVLEFMLTSSIKCAVDESEKRIIEMQQDITSSIPKIIHSNLSGNLNDERKKTYMRMLGLFTGLASKAMLQETGLIVDYKINGEDISEIEKLHELDISERLQLAVTEERYDDAANLKKIIEAKSKK
jgi:hypothetical protein